MNGLFWLDSGTGPPLVLLHGGFLHHGMWNDQVSAFASRYRVIAPDARGHGRSANATEPFRLTDDLAALLAVNGALDSPDHLGMAERLTAIVAGGRSVSIDGCAHYPNMERPDVFNEIIGDFLRTL